MIDGEDFATFEQQQTEPPAEEAPAAEEPQEELAPEEEEASAPEEGEPAPKPKKTAQERIDEITAARREAERDAKYWRDVAEGRARPPGAEPPAPAAKKAPNPQDYDFGETDPKYIEAIIDHRVNEGLDRVTSKVAQNMHVQAAGRAWEAKQDAARSDFADYDEKVIDGAHNWPCSEVAAEAIRTSDAGPRVAYHLASHPDEARRINGLSPLAQVLAIGKIEAEVSTTPAEAPARTTSAPKPPGTQARGAGGAFAPNAATTDFRQFEAMASRKA